MGGLIATAPAVVVGVDPGTLLPGTGPGTGFGGGATGGFETGSEVGAPAERFTLGGAGVFEAAEESHLLYRYDPNAGTASLSSELALSNSPP